MGDKASELRQLNLVTVLLAAVAFVGILTLGTLGKHQKVQRIQMAKTHQISERQMLERRRARIAQAVIASTSSHP